MTKIRKKGERGQARNFITRTQAVRKLQISLADFRRLCIYKGVYPREPRRRKKVSSSATPSTTFYFRQDIQYLLHEPLLRKFREHKALAKKIRKAIGKRDFQHAVKLEKIHTPRMRIDHIIRERYPTFQDALRDLDDALCMIYLFANLPTSLQVNEKTIFLCQRLCHEFEHYLIISRSLRKSFLSIKGIYYQANVHGQNVLWLVPYRFVQRITDDVDFRIMSTFVDFYTNLLGFINFRLYTTIGLVYPPKFNHQSAEQGGELSAYTLTLLSEADTLSLGNTTKDRPVNRKVQAVVDLVTQSVNEEDEGNEFSTIPDVHTDTIVHIEQNEEECPVDVGQIDENKENVNMFEPFSVYLSRESPRSALEFLLRAFGCKRIGWEVSLGDGAFRHDEDWSGWTHQIVDRPINVASSNQKDVCPITVSGELRQAGRIYIQPQWVWDCVNAGQLVRTDLYAPGAILPPHLSPWVKAKQGEYDPSKPAEPGLLLNLLEENRADQDSVASDDSGVAEAADVDVEVETESDSESHARELAAEVVGNADTCSQKQTHPTDSMELKEIKEKKKLIDRAKRQRQAYEEELEARRGMLSGKKRKLYDSIKRAEKRTQIKASKLTAKRIERERTRE